MPLPRVSPTKYCEHCGLLLERKRYNGRLEDFGAFSRRRYCDLWCAAGPRREGEIKINTSRKRASRYRASGCSICGTSMHLQVHHLNGNAFDNDPFNLMTLCRACHTKWHWNHGKAGRVAA